jgi:hypothetical protein
MAMNPDGLAVSGSTFDVVTNGTSRGFVCWPGTAHVNEHICGTVTMPAVSADTQTVTNDSCGAGHGNPNASTRNRFKSKGTIGTIEVGGDEKWREQRFSFDESSTSCEAGALKELPEGVPEERWGAVAASSAAASW